MASPQQKFLPQIQKSIATKSTLKIVAAALVIAIIAVIASVVSVNYYQQTQLEKSIEQLASTVENSASIAAFTGDQQLAEEVTRGLLTNQTVKKVVILHCLHLQCLHVSRQY